MPVHCFVYEACWICIFFPPGLLCPSASSHTLRHTHARECARGATWQPNTHPHAYNAVWIPAHVRMQQWRYIRHYVTHVVVCIAVILWLLLLLLLINLLLIRLLWLCKIFAHDENAIVTTVMLNTPLLTLASCPPDSKLKSSPTV